MEPMKGSLSEQYAFALDCKEPNNYTMIPNIVDHLTYDEIVDEETGAFVTKRLSVFAIHLYRVIKNIAGQEGCAWKNTEGLAQAANMSTGQVSKCKKELTQKFHELDGNPLIIITECQKTCSREDKKINGTIYHKIKLLNIWGWNRAFQVLKKQGKCGNVHKQQGLSPHESPNEGLSPHESPLEEARSPGERNKITNKIPLSKEQHPAAGADNVAFLDTQSSDVCLKIFNWFLKMGCDVRSATFFINNFSIEDLKSAHEYTFDIMKKKTQKNSTIANPVGYMRKVLENKWWVKKSNDDNKLASAS